MEKIRKIIHLHSCAKMSCREISKQIGVSKTTVNETIKDFKKSGLSYEKFKIISDSDYLLKLQQEETKSNEKYQELLKLFEFIEKEIKRTGVSLKLLHDDYILTNPNGYAYSRFCHHFQMWRKKVSVSMHLEHEFGNNMFVDYAGKKMSICNQKTGEIKEVETFVAILPASQLTYAEVSESQKKAEFILSNENALRFFGGVPNAIVPDCLKSAVTKADNYEPKINETYEDFARHYGCGIVPARARKPKDKALVENAVKLIYARVYAPLRNQKFYSITELNEAVKNLLTIHNDTLFKDRKTTRQEEFDKFEKSTLKPLPKTFYEIKEVEIRRAQKNYHIYIKNEDRYYSVPWRYNQKEVKIIHNNRTLEVYCNNERIAIHIKRSGETRRYVTIQNHMPKNHKFFASQTKENLLEKAKTIGDATVVFLQNLFNTKEPELKMARVMTGVLNLESKYGAKPLEKACSEALLVGKFTLGFVKNYLENGLYNSQENEEDFDLPHNPTTRGKEYYGGENERISNA